ncbi:PHP domain-containing protein [Natranaerobius thermophilus]|uniref:PHP domain protein n=1 Tax=Natranaerobius thermophilus (strain ATCC BAA-1301 / DSM 18059 / JW/NM-WN-LF) TaxID=457570 RepID=B2A3E2_NATTJ|nr:CehA/McbA family metallohydrolase [Natranaerobius thermophilus]ACB86371.1 PHP domain protein [Natranaerobius thermophilus JW/NM-WN-LF]
MYVYKGNIHIHTKYSDGTSTIEEIAEKAKKRNLDFIIINDHRHLLGKQRRLEGYYHDVLVIIGSEINLEKNHYLAIGIDEEIPRNEDNPQEVIDEVNRQGGIGFIAHPYEKGSPLVRNNRTYPWTDWDAQGFTGMEIINYSSQWRDGIDSKLQGLYANFINDQAYFKFPNKEAFEKWMELTKERRIVGIVGSDAHAPILSKFYFSITVLSYDYLFRCSNNYIYLEEPLSEEYVTAKQQVLNALSRGNLYICHDRKDSGDGLVAYLKSSDNHRFFPGSKLNSGTYTLVCQFKEFVPSKTKLKLHMYRDGHLISEYPFPFREKIRFKQGTYHLVISHPRDENWIILNPFYMWGQ